MGGPNEIVLLGGGLGVGSSLSANWVVLSKIPSLADKDRP